MTPNVEQFKTAYLAMLKAAVEKNPQDFVYGPEGVPACVEKMLPALARGGALVGPAVKAAARKCGIKPTAKAIKAFLTEVE